MNDKTRPSAIVRGNIDTEAVTVADLTVVELLTVCIEVARDEVRGVHSAMSDGPSDALGDESGAILREFSIAITHIEDAITRYNKATYRLKGTFAITDAERS
jgi:hypothetical protein